MTLSEDIIKKIDNEKISPKPRWVFLLNDFVYWGLFALALLLGSLVLGLIFYIYKMQDVFLMSKAAGFWLILATHAPYYWLASVIVFIGIAFYNFYHTPKGYRFSPIKVIAVNLIFSFLLGYVLSELGIGEASDKWLSAQVPEYSSCEARRMLVWNHPENGLLAGEIISLQKGEMILLDFHNQRWDVDISNSFWQDESLKKQGEKIKIVGQKDRSFAFKATEIRTWQCGCQKPENCAQGQCGRKCSQ